MTSTTFSAAEQLALTACLDFTDFADEKALTILAVSEVEAGEIMEQKLDPALQSFSALDAEGRNKVWSKYWSETGPPATERRRVGSYILVGSLVGIGALSGIVKLESQD